MRKNAADTSTIYFGLPYVPDTSDIVINEILFDAYPNGAEFVEIYNRSEHIMDIGQVTLTLIDSITDNVIQYCNIAEKGTLFYSGEYLAITNNYKGLENFYRTIGSGIIENKDFLSLPDKSGYVGLINLSGKIIDKIKYENNMHFTLIRNTEGVSLEKINPHLSGMNTNNWHSASESAGYATPAVKNSQYMQISELHKPSEVTIYPEIFSPNNDGTDDILFIEISPNDNNYVANINIFNSSGILIKRLINQSYCGTKEIFTWDGTSDDNKGLSTGIYIISIKLFNNRGKNEQINKTCVLK